jgi:hypothetical protein
MRFSSPPFHVVLASLGKDGKKKTSKKGMGCREATGSSHSPPCYAWTGKGSIPLLVAFTTVPIREVVDSGIKLFRQGCFYPFLAFEVLTFYKLFTLLAYATQGLGKGCSECNCPSKKDCFAAKKDCFPAKKGMSLLRRRSRGTRQRSSLFTCKK